MSWTRHTRWAGYSARNGRAGNSDLRNEVLTTGADSPNREAIYLDAADAPLNQMRAPYR